MVYTQYVTVNKFLFRVTACSIRSWKCTQNPLIRWVSNWITPQSKDASRTCRALSPRELPPGSSCGETILLPWPHLLLPNVLHVRPQFEQLPSYEHWGREHSWGPLVPQSLLGFTFLFVVMWIPHFKMLSCILGQFPAFAKSPQGD